MDPQPLRFLPSVEAHSPLGKGNTLVHSKIGAWGFPGGSVVKNPPANAGDTSLIPGLQSLGHEDPLEEGMATHSSVLAWRIPWTEEPVGYSPQGRKESDRPEVTEHALGRSHMPQGN